MTHQNIHLSMFYFSEEPNCRKNKHVVSRLGRRSNIPGTPTYQTCDLRGACQGPIRQRGLRSRAGSPRRVPLFPEPAREAEAPNPAPLHGGRVARERRGPRWNPSRENRGGGRSQAECPPRPARRSPRESEPGRLLSSQRETQGLRMKKRVAPKGRCLKHVRW